MGNEKEPGNETNLKDAQELQDLFTKRSSVKGQITKFKNSLAVLQAKDSLTPTDAAELTLRLRRFESLTSRFDDLQNQIEVLNSSNLDAEIDERDNIEQLFITNIARAQSLIQPFDVSHPVVNEQPMANESTAVHCEYQGANFKLPQIQIVKFDGAYFRWLEFRDTFVSLIHNNNRIAPIYKFHYLLSYLAGDASNVVANLEVSDANYSAAWKLLCERYDNKRQLITHHLNSLLNLQQITKESDKSLRFMVDHITKNLLALSSLGQPTDQWDVLVVHILSSKLDSRTNTKWEEWRGTLSDMPNLKQFQRFLIDRADVLESVNRTTSNTNKITRPLVAGNKTDHPKTNSFACVNSNDGKGYNSSYSCSLCRGDHRIYDCASFKALSVQERISTANRLRLCLNCLRYGHKVHSCRVGPCRQCKRRHNTLLHVPIDSTFSAAKGSTEIAKLETVASLSNQDYSQVLLSTALVAITNPLTNQSLKVRALLDCGSQSSFITQALKDKLHLKVNSSNVINIVGIGDTETNGLIETCTALLTSLTEPFKITQSFLVLPKLTGDIPKYTIDANQFQFPKTMQLADPSFNESGPVDILIGAEVFWDIIGDRQSSLGFQGPKLISSKFGWLISGPTHNDALPKPRNIQCHQSNASIILQSINQQLARFWDLEEIQPSHVNLSPSEQDCEAHFLANTHRLESGRFSVGLPLKDTPDCLGDSYHLAKRRMLQLEKRFRKSPDIKAQYVNFIKEYAELGHLTEMTEAKPTPSYFLCHHAVFKTESESTKIRVVFDGSASTSSGYSVNDILMVGPNLQDSLFSILIRARQHKYLLTGDVEKMYRQFLVNEKDRLLQMIVWREDESTPMKTLMLNTITYGMASSSYLSTRCLWQLGEECEDDVIKTIIQHDFMVDDLITGSDSEEMIIYIQQAVTRALKRGCLNLRKFKSNLPNSSCAFSSDESNLLFSESTSTLGIGWEPSSDELFFPIQRAFPMQNDKLTKRSMLSSLFKIFDPLGLLSPCIIQSKLLLQRLWSAKIDWDEPVPNEIENSWRKFILELPALLEVKIPRRTICDNPISIELHSFSDASQHAYGACIYLKSTNCHKETIVALLCSKSKVAPIKPTTIPRLELCASLLAANLCNSVFKSLRCKISRMVHWCDSSVVLGWLKASPQALKPFVAHRVVEICDMTDVASWRYVPTHLNPADLISRGVSPDCISSKYFWWSGPQFLIEPEDTWPILGNLHPPLNCLPETKQTALSLATSTENSIIRFENYSKFLRLKHIFAYVLRFIHNLKNQKNRVVGNLSVEELDSSLLHLCRLAQQQSFPSEYRLLSKGRSLGAKSAILSLTPFYDTNSNLIRVGGRIEASEFSFNKRHPILLHASHHLTKLILDYEHRRNLHAGPQLLLSIVRDFIWPINGRHLARRTAHNCVRCRRLQGRTITPIMGNLPSQRVTTNFPFSAVGIDFAGPFFILNRGGRGSKVVKCYLCIFICLRYKCVHLEAVSDMTKDAFILTFRRFVSRRGRPAEVFCDNGRNFVAGAKEINSFFDSNKSSLSDFASTEGIKFLFSPAYAPHFGGIWEAGVKSAKFHIKRVMGNSHLTFEELSTLFAQVESVLNSRPLCPLSSSPNDFQALTPGHFLIGRPLTALPSPSFENSNFNYQRVQQIHQHFWSRWQREYIAELQQRRKWKTNPVPVNIGDMVLLQEDNVPPLCWRLGRIQRLNTGSDGVARVAEVDTIRGCVRRPLVRICPLPTAEELRQ